MNRFAILGLMLLLFFAGMPADADLQTVVVGGELRIRAQYWQNAFNARAVGPAFVGPQIRWPGALLTGRAIGDRVGGQTITSFYNWDDRGPSYDVVEQRTRLWVQADFTENVRSYIELDSFDVWGEDFRSDHVTGFDRRAASGDDIEVFQAYIEADNMWNLPLRARIGRQELNLGSTWLVGDATNNPEFSGISFDGIRLTYATDMFSIDAFYTKLFEAGIVEQDGDVDFMGVYGSYTGLENMTIDAYWFWLRDARSINDTNFPWFVEWLENVFSVDDYDVTNIHTVGLRAAGTFNAFDFDVEGAYQFGDADAFGRFFRPFLYGDDDADFSNWAMNAEVGYTFDVNWQPRVHGLFAYVGGEDNRDLSFWDWINPFDRPEASVSFNRLFSNKVYSPFIDEIAQQSNFWTAQAGVTAMPLESVEVGMDIKYFESIATFDMPAFWTLGRWRIPLAPALPWWTQASDDELGWELAMRGTYHYTEDLTFELGWHHLFVGDGLGDGNFSDGNGIIFNGGSDNDDSDYIYFESSLRF